ncbi:hypothetical protein niasHT_024778 [Heterodera trifolii]|uniref:Ubiquitin-like domain-containing protein n=1 Tax=Heterodera trifolii TaxID=157864 RepID=A0ABD2JH00_9BILA
MKQFGLSLFSVGISAGLMTMLLLLMVMPSSTDGNGIKITVKADQKIFKKNIFSKSNQTTVVVQEGSTTVKEFKERITEMTEIPPTKQILKGRNPDGTATLLVDSETMADNDINEGSTVLLFIKFEIEVTADGIIPGLPDLSETFTVDVHGMDKVNKLKRNIMETLEKKSKTELESDHHKIWLQYGQNGDYDILNEQKTIDDYQIKKGDIVHLSIGEFYVVVKYEENNKFTTYFIWMKGEETVATLKKKIKNRNGVEPDDQTLKVKPKKGDGGALTVLEDKKTMTNYGIGEGTTVLFVVNAEDTVQSLKEKIYQSIGILPEKQVLSRDPDDAIVFLSLPFYLSVRKSREAEEFRVNSTDTVQIALIMTMLLLLLMMMMPSSTADGSKYEITVTADEEIFKKRLSKNITNEIIIKVDRNKTVEYLKKKIIEKMDKKSITKYGSDPKRLTLIEIWRKSFDS